MMVMLCLSCSCCRKGDSFGNISLFLLVKENARRMVVLTAVQPAPGEPSMRQRTAPRQMLKLSQWRGLSHIFARYCGTNASDGEAFPFLLRLKYKREVDISIHRQSKERGETWLFWK